MVRSLVATWKFVYYCDFDTPMTKFLFNQLIYDMEAACGIKVLANTCDQAGGNEGFQKTLGATVTKPWSRNPYDSSRKIYFLYDYVHVFKNTRNHLLDKTITVNGLTINPKKHLQELQQYCRANEVSAGSFLKDIVLNCRSSDRQTTSLARVLLSSATANLLRMFFPDDVKKMVLADIFDILDKGRVYF